MKNSFSRIGTHISLLLGALVMMLPFYWMAISSFKTPDEIALMPPTWWPESFQFVNYEFVLETGSFLIYIRNSIIVTACVVVLTVLVTILTAFAFSRLRFPGRDLLFSMFLGMMMVPFELLAVVNYGTVVKMNLVDTYVALILPCLGNMLYIYILRNFFLGIPESLYYAARMDGSTNWKYLWRIMVPVAKPAVATVALLSGIDTWNAFLWPLLVTNAKEMRTVTVGLTTFVQESGVRYERLMAAATLVVLPMIILFLFARKQVIEAVARGGLKG